MAAKRKVPLKAPFPWFGGKSSVADIVWSRFGDVSNYIEDFFGSGAMLLRRPHAPRIETVNDFDCYVANFWRATSADPESVARYADWPVNETDLHARHRWLVLSEQASAFRKRMRSDPEYFDPKIAGWWVWGLCCWIGGGWCSYSNGVDRRPALSTEGEGISRRLPDISGKNGGSGRGIHQASGPKQQLPDLAGERGAAGRGIHASGAVYAPRAEEDARPRLSANNGVHAKAKPPAEWEQRPGLHETGNGVHASMQLTQKRPGLGDGAGGPSQKGFVSIGPEGRQDCDQRLQWLLNWFDCLRDRLRNVRVCCGDWQRICDSESVTTRLGLTGNFKDPPYSKNVDRMHAWVKHLQGAGPAPDGKASSTNRDGYLYATDSGHDVDLLVARVHVWCAARGADPRMRIALCGYAGEHEALEALGWEVVAWKSNGGYGNRSGKRDNARRERIWFSPHCLRPDEELPLFRKSL